jgi:hypothetical protein
MRRTFPSRAGYFGTAARWPSHVVPCRPASAPPRSAHCPGPAAQALRPYTDRELRQIAAEFDAMAPVGARDRAHAALWLDELGHPVPLDWR